MSAAITQLGKLFVADDTGFSTNVIRLDIMEFDPGVSLELRDMNSTRGKYTKDDARVRQNRTNVLPRITCQPTAVEMATILGWTMGGTPTGSPTITYPFGNTAVAKSLWYVPNNGIGWQCLNCAVDSLTVHGSSGEPLTCNIDLVGQTYVHTSTSPPATVLDITTAPYIFSDMTLTYGGAARLVRDLSVSIHNNIDRSRFLNSLTLTALNKLHREVTWSIEVPAGDYDSDWIAALTAGVSTVSTWTQTGSLTALLTMTSPAVRYIPKNPSVPFQAESFLRLEGQAYSADGAAECLTISQHQ